jgi:DNA invertase Pin-like site-specific DNA recombinase
VTFGGKGYIAMATGKFVSYLRVSTDQQGHDGLGIEAQRKAVSDYLNGGRWRLLREFVEVESGKRADRPNLLEAISHCKATGGTLVIAKLDRLSRNVAFISKLMESDVEFVAVDFPQANRLTVHILAAVAEHEREMVSQRTKVALAAVKARGKTLGNPNGANALRAAGAGKAGWNAGADGNRAAADRHAARVMPAIDDIRASGITSLSGIARELNAREIRTANDGKWYATTVRNVLARA